MAKYFITVEWCNNGHRGIFCDGEGNAFSQDEPFTTEKIQEILGPFALILAPNGEQLFSPEEILEYTRWVPLGEYMRKYGIALKNKEAPCPNKPKT